MWAKALRLTSRCFIEGNPRCFQKRSHCTTKHATLRLLIYSLACIYTDNWKVTLLEHSVMLGPLRSPGFCCWLYFTLDWNHDFPLPWRFRSLFLSWSCLSTGHPCPCPAFCTRGFRNSPNTQLVRGVCISNWSQWQGTPTSLSHPPKSPVVAFW